MAAILTLGIGIGLTTAMLSLFYVAVLNPLPVPDPDRLVEITGAAQPRSVSVDEWFGRASLLESVASFRFGRRPVRLGNRDLRLQLAEVSGSFFEVFRVNPFLGQFLGHAGAGSARARLAVVSYDLWRNTLGADQSLLGRIVSIGSYDFVLSGVAPPRFAFPADTDIWIARPDNGRQVLTLDMSEAAETSYAAPTGVIGRCRESADRRQVTAQVIQLQRELERAQYTPAHMPSQVSVRDLREVISGRSRPTMVALLAGCGIVLLTAIANFAHLSLVRTISRSREMALRRALGADSAAIFRIFLLDNGVIGAVGCALAIVLAAWALALVRPLLPAMVPNGRAAAIGREALVASVTLTFAIVVGVSALGAMRVARRDLGVAMRATQGVVAVGLSGRVRSSVLIVHVAAAITLLVGASVLFQGLRHLQAMNLGFEPQGLITAEVTLPERRYSEAARRGAWDSVLSSIEALPGVQGATLTDRLPLSSSAPGKQYVATIASPGLFAVVRKVTGAYFDTLGILLAAGRGFSASNGTAASTVAVVSKSCAEALGFDGQSVGWTIEVEGVLYTVIGISGAVAEGRADDSVPQVYLPLGAGAGVNQDTLVLAARVRVPMSAIVAGLPQRIASVDPAINVSRVRPMAEIVELSLGQPRLRSLASLGLALTATLVAVFGVYAGVAHGVAQRSRELAIRTSLGCTPVGILTAVVTAVLEPLCAGLALGLLVAATFAGSLGAFVYGVDPYDPASFIGSAAILSLAVLIAAGIPARPAMKADPAGALRSD